jgi:Zn-dependent protease with chaperone function
LENDKSSQVLFLSAIAHFVAAALLAVSANWLSLISWRRTVDAHWTERARLLYPARVSAALNVVIIPAFLVAVHSALIGWEQESWPLDGVSGLLGVLLGSYPFSREIHPQLDFQTWRFNVITTWGIRLGVFGSLGLACALMPIEFGWKTLAITIGYLAIQFAIQWGLILRYLRWVKYMTPAKARLQQIVDTTAARLDVPVRATWQLGGLLAQAYAFTNIGQLAFSNRLLAICSDEEVAAVCAHELAHLKESKAVRAGRLLGSLSLFPLIYMVPAVHMLEGLGYLFPLMGMFLIAKFAGSLSRKMEKQADQLALNQQATEGVYASALEKIYRENQMPAVNSNNKATHPHLYDRLLAAGITPDYPRPAKPKSFTAMGIISLFALGIALGIAFARN